MPASLFCFVTAGLNSAKILFAYDNLTIDAHRKALNKGILEQYRIIKEKATDIHALNIRLFYDLTRLKRVPATITFTDIVSKYNLLVHSITSLSLQRSNIPKEPIMCTFTTLKICSTL